MEHAEGGGGCYSDIWLTYVPGCHVLLAEQVDPRESVPELLSNYFFAPHWAAHSGSQKKSQLKIPIPKGILMKEGGSVVPSKVKTTRLNIHQQMAAFIDSEDAIENVNVIVDSRKYVVLMLLLI